MMRLVTCLFLLAVLAACVSKSTYDELQEEFQRERSENAALRAQLNSRQMKSIESLEVRLAACNQQVVATKEAGEKLAKKSEEAGYYKGASDFNRSLQVVGVPNSDGWWIFADHYYTFQVRLAGNPLYSMTVETEDQMPPIIQGLALLSEIREAMPYKP